MTDLLDRPHRPYELMTPPVAPARIWTWTSLLRWLRPGYGSRANARDACRQLGPARQRTLAMAWQTGHPSAMPPCGHLPDLHQCPACRAEYMQPREPDAASSRRVAIGNVLTARYNNRDVSSG